MADMLTALVTALPGLAKLGQALASASDEKARNQQLIEFQGAVIDFQSKLASVQQENATLQANVRGLEDQLRGVSDWAAEKQRYSLVSRHRNSFYALREASAESEAPHYLCPNCFAEKRKSLLTQFKDKESWIHFTCGRCKWDASTGMRGIGGPQYAEVNGE